MTDQKTKYGLLSIILHWLGFVILVVAFESTNSAATNAAGDFDISQRGVHMSVMVSFGLVLVFRVIWRAYSGFRVEPGKAAAQVNIARILMVSMLVLILLSLLSGLSIALSNGAATPLPIGVTLPVLPALANWQPLLREAHHLIVHALLVCTFIHMGAALVKLALGGMKTIMVIIKPS